ncbi:DNA-binding NarL/FixJ family response regulator [Clavibacter michiganensis]|uniref:response regulator n=1 Tax=Clavibacter michiganensis TaxID=28447 RepID=UPI00195A7DAD|nr:response regulator transcription factor [Clavibacter michiganensis]MBM7412316.1 DNA-binding NarL/FixJ family response regulator [Clavibacter michiganensis]
MSGTITIVVADDQPVILFGIRAMLEYEADFTVVATAANGRLAVEAAAEHRPDVVVMDIRMPELDGIAATRRILDAQTAGAVLMITTFDDEEYLLDSARAGASGFLLKDAGADVLAAAVRSAVRGDALIDPAMTRGLLQRRIEATRISDPAKTAQLATLTDRERDVLAALVDGLSNLEIAGRLFMSEGTVKSHVSAILAKSESRSRVGAAVFAYESGFVVPGEGDRRGA